MDFEDDINYIAIVRLEVLLAPPPLAIDSSDDSMIEDPLEISSTYDDRAKIFGENEIDEHRSNYLNKVFYFS